MDHGGVATEIYAGGSWIDYSPEMQTVMLALVRSLSASNRATTTARGLAPAVGTAPGPALTVADHLALGLGGVDDPPVDEIFGEAFANCVSQLAVPWLTWATGTIGVRVSVPIAMPADAYASLAAAFTAAEPGDTDGEPALVQLHDLLDTGNTAPTCQPPDSATQ